MTLLSGFLEVLLRALVFIGLALSAGGIFFYFAVLRRQAADNQLIKRNLSLIAVGAFLTAFSQAGALVIEPWALADESGRWPLEAFLSTGFARSSLIYSALGAGAGMVSLWLRKRLKSSALWMLAAVLAAAVVISGAWLTHGVSRLQFRGVLMGVTVLHQTAAAVWIGGTIHLAALWRAMDEKSGRARLWPHLIINFSPVALGSAFILVASGIFLSYLYIGNIGGLAGTAYGLMVVTKIILMLSVMLFGGMNFLIARGWKRDKSTTRIFKTVPASVEAEAGIGAIIFMAAAALTSQPPAVDVTSGRALPSEVLHIFAPKAPQLAPAPFDKMLAGAPSSLDIYSLPTALEQIQSNFNHNISGMFVILLGLGALLAAAFKPTAVDQKPAASRLAHWPLLFIPFGLFILIIAEPTGWPLGKEGFFETLMSPEVLTHRLAVLLVAGLGVFEWSVQTGRLSGTKYAYAFPLLCLIGGAMLLTHSHSAFASKWAFLIEVSHNAIGILAVLMGAGRWIELRLPGQPEGRIAGYLWPIFFMLVGMVLLFYKETQIF